MPFTPFHFGPHACISLSLYHRLDIPVFIGANIAVDIEPLLVILFNFNYPLHGYCHTLLIGGFVGFLFATALYPLRNIFKKIMNLLGLPYAPSYKNMVFSGILGVWVHILFDAFLYTDIRPFFPFRFNPLYSGVSMEMLYNICAVSFVPALAIYIYVVFITRKKGNTEAN